MKRRTLVLIDGEHYPPVVRAAVDGLREEGRDIVGAAMLGGKEKLAGASAAVYTVPELVTGGSALAATLAALDLLAPDEVYDLSGEPVLDARKRLLVAAHVLRRGVGYRGAGFAFDPPPRPRLSTKPSIAVIGTGKRTGKTALAGELARVLARDGRPAIIVAMGRGGPGDPELVDPAAFDLTPAGLLSLARTGRHAASDHLEDALTAGAVTIGTRRCGDGLAGAAGPNGFEAGVALANTRPEPIVVFEGSGAAIPPVHADATVCVVPSSADPELVGGYLGPYALLLADLVVITLQGGSSPSPLEGGTPAGGEGQRSSLPPGLEALEGRIGEIVPGTPVLRTMLRPWPLAPVSGRTVFFATTATEPAAARAAEHLETRHHATVVGRTRHLADRSRLGEDLAALPDDVEVLLTELKAAAVDVVTAVAAERGLEVVYCDNRPEPVNQLDADAISSAFERIGALAVERFESPGL